MIDCPTCNGELRRGHLMCGTCWSNVPRELRRAVTKTWVLAFSNRCAGTHSRQRLADYVKARDAAIESVTRGKA